MNRLGVSVVIPVYNAAETIEKCLENIIEDEYCTEIIIVNDGSTDNTVNIVEKVQKKTDKIRLITTLNGGVSKARNIGLFEVKGEYLMFVDADDFLSESAIKSMYKYSKENNLDVCCIGIIEKNSVKSSGNEYLTIDNNSIYDKSYIGKIIDETNPRSVCAKIFKTSIIHTSRVSFDEKMSYAEDLEFMMQVFKYVGRIGFYSGVNYFAQNINPNSLSKRYHDNIEYVLEKNKNALLDVFRTYPEYEDIYFQKSIGIQFYNLIAFSDNLFRNGSPYSFWQSRKCIKHKLKEVGDKVEFNIPQQRFLPKKNMDKIYYNVIKTKFALLIALLFYCKNIVKRLKQGL